MASIKGDPFLCSYRGMFQNYRSNSQGQQLFVFLSYKRLSLLLYHQPSVEDKPGKAYGWSFNVQQNIGKKWAIFGRANGVSHALTGFNQSYVLGGVYNNPFNRNMLDQIGIAYALNKVDKEVMQSNRNWENVLEGYYSFGIGSTLIITPDIQFYINPALNNKSHTATVASIRATFMF